MGALIRPACQRCRGSNVKLRRQIIVNGTSQLGWWCLNCERWAERPIRWLSHEQLTVELGRYRATIEDVPIIKDESEERPCIICGAPGEYHHWAPQALSGAFGHEWVRWPGAWLCMYHHRLWHRVVTPMLVMSVSNREA